MTTPSARRLISFALVLALLPAPVPVLARPAEQAPAAEDAGAASGPATPTGRAELDVTVRDAEQDPVGDARFVLSPMEGGQPARSVQTDARGHAVIEDVSYGYYRYAVGTPQGPWVGNRVLLVPPEQKVDVTVTLGPFLPEDERAGLDPKAGAPGFDGEAIGVARLLEKTGPRGLAWFESGKGVAVIVGAAVLMVGLVIALTDTDSEEVASPSQPSR